LKNSSSALDGAVDDLFSEPVLSEATNPAVPASSGVTFISAAAKSELVFDAEGNMVLQTVSQPAERISSAEATTTVDSATCGYDYAYRRPKPTKWTDDDTKKFYEALEIYGSDQMLINTMLPNFTAVQIRQKFKAEQRNAPTRFNAVLYGSRKKLESTKFEQQHGLILNPVFDHKNGQAMSSDVTLIATIAAAAVECHPSTEGSESSPEKVKPQSEEAQAKTLDPDDPLASLFS
jgi:hypothetical protein